jgi:transposase-like protein
MTHRERPAAPDRITGPPAERGFDGIARAVAVLLDEVMGLERAPALGAAPCRRIGERAGYANGYKPETPPARLGPLTVEVPRARGVEFSPSAPEKGARGARALKLAVAARHVQGASAREVAAITEQLRGLGVTGGQASRAAQAPDGEPGERRARPIGETPYLILDARYGHVRHGGAVVSCAAPTAVGIDPKGERSVLGVSVSLPGAGAHRRDFLASPRGRGPHGARPVVSGAHGGPREALKARLTGVPWQRRQFRLVENALASVPKPAMRKAVVASIRAVLDAPGRPGPSGGWISP